MGGNDRERKIDDGWKWFLGLKGLNDGNQHYSNSLQHAKY
jgi:hypothetical protein